MKNSLLEAQGKKILMSVIVLYTLIFATYSICAFDFDNVKTYDEATKTATITNAFGLGDKIADIQLTSNLNEIVMKGKDRKVAEIKLMNYQKDFIGAFDKIDTTNVALNTKTYRTFTYKYKKVTGIYEYPHYTTICKDEFNEKNQTTNNICHSEFVRNDKQEIVEWISFKELNELPEGNNTIGIFTEVREGDYVDWIPTFFGVKIDEWATWQTSYSVDMIAYWNFNQTTNLTDIYKGIYNSTAVNTGIVQGYNGISGLAWASLGSTQVDFINNGVFDTPNATGQVTLSAWVKYKDTPDGACRPMVKTASYQLYEDNGWRAGGIWQSDGTEKETGASGTFTAQTWYNLVLVANGTDSTYYQNGAVVATGTYDGTIRKLTNMFSLMKCTIANMTQDESAIWNRSLTSAEITALYDGGTGTFFTGGGWSK